MQIDNPMVAIDRRRGQVQNAEFSQGGVFAVNYTFPVVGAGEAFKDINFPCMFVEKPALTSGGEVDPWVPVSGNYPWCSAMAGGWVTVQKGQATYWVGCRVILVVGGSADQKSTIHFHVEGKALQGPVT